MPAMIQSGALVLATVQPSTLTQSEEQWATRCTSGDALQLPEAL